MILKGILGNKKMRIPGFEPFDEGIIYYEKMIKNLDLLLYNIHN